MVPVWLGSFFTYGGAFGEWYSNIFLYGVRKISRSMTKLSKTKDQVTRSWWEPLFELWWGFSIKYIVPFALITLMLLSMKADIDAPYSGYHLLWQCIGISIPALGFIGFIIPVFAPPGPEPFDHDVDGAFNDADYAGVGAESTLAANNAKATGNEVEMKKVEAGVVDGQAMK